MNLIASFALFFSFAATVQGESVKFSYKQNANLVYSEAYWIDEACLEASYISVFAGDGFFKEKGSKKIPFEAAEVYGTFLTDCTATGATRSELYLFDEDAQLTFGGLDNATVAISATTFLYTSPCVIETYIDEEFGYEYAYYSCGEGTSVEATVSLNVLTKTFGGVYQEKSQGVRKGPGFVTKYKSSSKCKEQQTAAFTNLVIDDVPYVVAADFGYGDICKVKEGYSERYYYS